MNNLISLYMNYKIQRLIEYGIFLLDDDSEFIRGVFKKYFSVFIDNYYYGIFYTIEDSNYSFDNLHLEFQGIMEEMLDEYRQYELEESNEEYTFHINTIKALKDYSLEVLNINFLEFKGREEITTFVSNYIEMNEFYRKEIGNRVSKFTKLVKDTYRVTSKLLNYQDNYFNTVIRKFVGHEEIVYYELKYNIKLLNNYRKTMVSRVYLDDGLEKKKLECLIQKVSLYILKNILEKKEIPIIVMELDDSFFNRGKIDDDVFNLIDNPLFRKYVSFGVKYLYKSKECFFRRIQLCLYSRFFTY